MSWQAYRQAEKNAAPTRMAHDRASAVRSASANLAIIFYISAMADTKKGP